MASGQEYFQSILSQLGEIQTFVEKDPDVLDHFVTELSELDVLVDDLNMSVEERMNGE